MAVIPGSFARSMKKTNKLETLKPGVTMTTKLPDGTLITETYPYKKMPRNP
jgi:hypothetical protein